ncbi:MAG: xylulokinase [Deinococcus sp.]|nr:xylulokinase [Deinococcus sp.]
MPYLLGIDVGSSATKVGLFAPDGRAVVVASRSYPTSEPHPGYKEQDPERWWQAVVESIQEVRSQAPAGEILGIGTTGHISSLTFVDTRGRSLRPAIGFQDQRSLQELEELYTHFTREELAAHLGIDLPPAATWPLPRLLWFQKHEPQTLEGSYCVLQAKDFVNFRLTGEFASDLSSNRGIVDFAAGGVAHQVFSTLHLPERLLPRMCRPEEVMGTVCPTAAQETGLPAGLPVVTGWNDLNAAVLGTGTVQPGDAFNITGTSEHLGVVTSASYQVPELMYTPFLPGKKLFYGVTSCGGGSLEWYRRNFQPDIEQLMVLAEKAPAGSEALLFLPYLEGERSPIWDPRASGAFVGIRTLHGPGHFVRAILEGVAFGLRRILELVEQHAGRVQEPLRISGGAARGRLWNQIKADVWGRNIAVPEHTHAGILGAAMLASVAVRQYPSCEAAAQGMVRLAGQFAPSPGRAVHYGQLYQLFVELYPALRTCFTQLYQQRVEGGPAHG